MLVGVDDGLDPVPQPELHQHVADVVLVVPSETNRRSAMSELDRPRASRPSTSTSRRVRSATGRWVRVGGARCTKASITRRVTPGASRASPEATTRIAAASSSAGASLSRKPEAPAGRRALSVPGPTVAP